MRSGTSMMMQALMAGGLDGLYDPSRNVMNKTFGDHTYMPNSGGFFEPSKKQLSEIGFPRNYDGKLMKVLHGGITKLAPMDYKVVLMRRDPEEIRQSYEAFFQSNGKHPIFDKVTELIDLVEEHINNRKDMSLTVLHYRDVVADPLSAFCQLSEDGWPIDVPKAASIVDPEQCRFRLEKMVVGL